MMVPVFAWLGEYKWLLLIAVLVGAYGWGRHDGEALALRDERRAAEVVRVATDAAQRGAAEEIAKLEVKHVTVQRRIERETREVPVYRDCKHSDDGLRALNDALANRAEPVGGGELSVQPGDVAGQ